MLISRRRAFATLVPIFFGASLMKLNQAAAGTLVFNPALPLLGAKDLMIQKDRCLTFGPDIGMDEYQRPNWRQLLDQEPINGATYVFEDEGDGPYDLIPDHHWADYWSAIFSPRVAAYNLLRERQIPEQLLGTCGRVGALKYHTGRHADGANPTNSEPGGFVEIRTPNTLELLNERLLESQASSSVFNKIS